MVPRSRVPDAPLQRGVADMRAANDTPIPVLGRTTIWITVADLCLPAQVLVSDHVLEPILGVDWLRQQQGQWDFGGNHITMMGRKIQLVVEKQTRSCRRIVVDRHSSGGGSRVSGACIGHTMVERASERLRIRKRRGRTRFAQGLHPGTLPRGKSTSPPAQHK